MEKDPDMIGLVVVLTLSAVVVAGFWFTGDAFMLLGVWGVVEAVERFPWSPKAKALEIGEGDE